MQIGTYKFLAEPFHSDVTGSVSLAVMGNHLLNCAGMNAEENGFGIDYLNEHHYTWVLSRLAMEFDEMPKQYSTFSIDTWVESVMSLFSGRNFVIRNAEGAPIGYARSMWAMIDLDSRQPANLLTLRDGIMTQYVRTDLDCPIDKPGKIRVTAAEPQQSVTIRFSDIDINRHVNSVRYIEHILNLFPLDKFETSRIKRFEIAYVTESVFGDVLDLYIDSDEATDTHQIEVKKQGTNDVVCRAKITFTKN